ncbi:aminoglycoside 6-adenylyltransferase [Micromonospora echinofusca]|uniref:ATP-grasp domain-containing protein n=1 Tax=Micromonospora echinofusca TaxID=47858 RepID=A0ABS3VPW5_MICEH|nr:aminoglycoside 6-adenylyltransferase [Micromonospora echinofusca]MBO4206518.1 ATP-grasp domain-containing protein [Micromonospora echinofusca]
MDNDPCTPPHLLVVLGLGGPRSGRIIPSVAGLARVTWLVVGREQLVPEQEWQAMRAHGVTLSSVDDAAGLALATARHRKQPVDGLLAFSENAQRLGAAIAEAVEVPFNPPRTVDLLTHKDLQREALAAAGIPGPAHHAVRHDADLVPAAAHVGFPAVFKPARGAGSILATLVGSVGELHESWLRARSTFAGLRGDRHETVVLSDTTAPYMVLEQLLVGRNWHGDERLGDYASVECAIYRGTVTVLAVSDKLNLSGFRENGQLNPSTLPAERQRELTDMAVAALEALGVREGFAHVECKLTADGPRIIEVNGRPGGGFWDICAHGADYDLVAHAARAALGRGPVPVPRFVRHTGLLTPHLPDRYAGRQIEVTIDDSFVGRPGVHSLSQLRPWSFDPAMGTGKAAYAHVSGPDRESVLAHGAALDAAIRVRVLDRHGPVDQKQLLARIETWAAGRPDVVALVLTGSYARDHAPTDDLSDLDVEVVAEDFDDLLHDESWWRDLGDVWTWQIVPAFAAATTQCYPMLHVAYAGAVKVDFTLVDRVRITGMAADGALDRVYAPGYRVLLDREGLTRGLPAATGRPVAVGPMPADEFAEVVRSFWYEAPLVAKYLLRNEPWEAKLRDWTMKSLLLRMIEWHAWALRGHVADGYHRGRGLPEWADPQTWAEVQEVFGRLDADDSWRALHATMALFGRLGGETARTLRLWYPTRLDHTVRSYVAGLTPTGLSPTGTEPPR